MYTIVSKRNKLLIQFAEKYFEFLSKRNLSSTEYCLDQVKKFDYENFVCTLLLKSKARLCGVAIRAFNVEVSRVQDQISDHKIGLMRLKFWEDAIEKCYSKENKIPNHPVVIELSRVLRSNKFTKRYFQSLIKSRKEIMVANSFPSLQSMELYAEQSVSSVYYLILEGSDIRNVHADHAASHLGKAQGLCQQLRCLSCGGSSGFIPLPQELLGQHQVSHEDVVRAKDTAAVRECVFAVATRAHHHLEKARSLTHTLSHEARDVLLPAVAVHTYLQRLLKADCNVYHPTLQRRHLTWIPAVWWNHFRHTY